MNGGKETRLSQDPIFAEEIRARMKKAKVLRVFKNTKLGTHFTIVRYLKGEKMFAGNEDHILEALELTENNPDKK